MKLIFDIETVGMNFNDLDDSQQEYLLRYAIKEPNQEIRESKIFDAIRYLNLYPFTAKIVSLALLNIETEKLLVLFLGKTEDSFNDSENNIKYRAFSEPELIKIFWEQVAKSNQLISFNGKNFDLPFITIRSAIHQIKPTKNFHKKYRKNHIDLLDEFTFYGKIRKFNFDFYCKSFGIKSPKTIDVNGMKINELFYNDEVKKIAEYCAKDVKATFELYKIWKEFLNY